MTLGKWVMGPLMVKPLGCGLPRAFFSFVPPPTHPLVTQEGYRRLKVPSCWSEVRLAWSFSSESGPLLWSSTGHNSKWLPSPSSYQRQEQISVGSSNLIVFSGGKICIKVSGIPPNYSPEEFSFSRKSSLRLQQFIQIRISLSIHL